MVAADRGESDLATEEEEEEEEEEEVADYGTETGDEPVPVEPIVGAGREEREPGSLEPGSGRGEAEKSCRDRRARRRRR